MKNKLLLDVHTHTLASGHAYGTVRENALGAKEKGLVGLGISEHGPGMPGTCRVPKRTKNGELSASTKTTASCSPCPKRN